MSLGLVEDLLLPRAIFYGGFIWKTLSLLTYKQKLTHTLCPDFSLVGDKINWKIIGSLLGYPVSWGDLNKKK